MVRLVILRLTESYFRNRGLYQLPLVLMIVLAGVYVLRAPRVYISSGTVYVQTDSLLSSLTNMGGAGFSWTTPAQATVNKIYELIGTDAFVRSAIHRTDLEARITADPLLIDEVIWEFREAVSLTVIGENLVRVSGTYTDPQIAQQIALSVIDAYTQWQLNAAQRESVVAQEFFNKLLEPYQQELEQAQADLQAYLRANPPPLRGERPDDQLMELELLQGRVDRSAERVMKAINNVEEARLAQSKAESDAHEKFRVVDAPKLPFRPTLSLKTTLRDIGIFMAVGVILSVGGIAAGAVLDRSVRFPVDVRHSLDLPVLAVVPEINAVPALGLVSWLLFWRRPRPAVAAQRGRLIPAAPAPAFVAMSESELEPVSSFENLIERAREVGQAPPAENEPVPSFENLIDRAREVGQVPLAVVPPAGD